jgi:hypothetical protein
MQCELGLTADQIRDRLAVQLCYTGLRNFNELTKTRTPGNLRLVACVSCIRGEDYGICRDMTEISDNLYGNSDVFCFAH